MRLCLLYSWIGLARMPGGIQPQSKEDRKCCRYNISYIFLQMDIFPRKTVRPFEPFAPKFDRASTVSLAYSNAMVLVCIVVFKKIAPGRPVLLDWGAGGVSWRWRLKTTTTLCKYIQNYEYLLSPNLSSHVLP